MSGLTVLYDELRAYKRSRVLAFAVRSGILRSLELEPQTSTSVANRVGYEGTWIQPVLNLLVELQLAECDNDQYRLTADGATAKCDTTLDAFAGYHLHCFEAWLALPDVVSMKTGGGFHRQRIQNSYFCRSYLKSMDVIAQSNLDFLKGECREHLLGRVLDLGAGPATLCRGLAEDGQLDVTAVDLTSVVETARSLYGETEYFHWVPGDFPAWTPESPFDAVFCSHLLEYCSADRLDTWLKRVCEYLQPGGKAVFVTFLRSDDGQLQVELDMFELSTGVNGDSLGRCHTEQELSDALHRAGFVETRSRPFPTGPSYNEHLIVCEKPANKGSLS